MLKYSRRPKKIKLKIRQGKKADDGCSDGGDDGTPAGDPQIGVFNIYNGRYSYSKRSQNKRKHYKLVPLIRI